MTKIPKHLTEIPLQETKTILINGFSSWKVVEETRDKVEKISENARKMRIHLIRHYPYMENEDFFKYRPLLDMKKRGIEMTMEQEKAFNELSKKIQIFSDLKDTPLWLQKSINQIFAHPEKTCVVCDNDATQPLSNIQEKRTVVTARNFEAQFPWILLIQKNLPESDKDSQFIDNQAELAQFLSQTFSHLSVSLPPEIDTIVIVSNRSHVPAFNNASISINLSHEETIKFFEKIGFISYDFHLTSKKTKKNSWEEIDIPLFKIDPDSRKSTEYKIRAFQKAEEIQSRSLEKKLWQWKTENFVLDRELYYKKEVTEKHEDGERKVTKEYPVMLDNLFDTWGTRQDKKYVLRAHVGSGKSFILSEVVKKLASDVDKQVIFLEWGRLEEKNNEWVTTTLTSERIQEIFRHAKEEKRIICIDAIDEIRDAKIKNTIKQQLEEFTGQCFIVTRKSEFFTDTNFTFLHLRPLDTNEFLKSRFWDTPLWERKIHDIINKLKTINLHSEIQGNPLLLSFIVILTKLTDEEIEEYKEIWVIDFEDIKTKAQLYESITRLTLVEHEKEKGNCTNDIDTFNDKMDELGEFAYYLFKKEQSNNLSGKPKPPKKSTLASLNILFSADGANEYSFIHKSFYEFFLARHLAKMEKGQWSREIYDFRNDKKTGNWNDWREFRPVVLFYGEMLGNTNRLEDLKKFLGNEGLLKDDDMFGENFFMGLEILYKLPENIRWVNPMKGVLEMYEKKVEDWDVHEIIRKFEGIKRLSRNLGYRDALATSIISDNFLKEVTDKKSVENRNHYSLTYIATLLLFVAQVGTPYTFKKAKTWTKILMKNNHLYFLSDIIKEMAIIWTPYAIKTVMSMLKIFLKNDMFWDISVICQSIGKIWTSHAIEAAINWIELLKESGKDDMALDVCLAMISSWNLLWKEKAINEGNFLSKKNNDIYYINEIKKELARHQQPTLIEKERVSNSLFKSITQINPIWNTEDRMNEFRTIYHFYKSKKLQEVQEMYINLSRTPCYLPEDLISHFQSPSHLSLN